MALLERIRLRVFQILEVAEDGDTASRFFDRFILLLIASNVLASTLATVDSIGVPYRQQFRWFETASVAIFSVEYVARVWSVTAGPRFRGAVRGRLRFLVSPMALVDLLAVAPFFLPFVGVDLRFVRALRMFRLFRMVKVARYSESLRTLTEVLRSRKQQLVIAFLFALVMLLISSSALFYVEHGAQPTKFSSIPASMWWGVCTLTTVGYGDIHPITPLGKLLGGTISLLGVGLFAMPAGILAGGFSEWAETHAGERVATTCPHCGEALTDPVRAGA